MNGHFRTQDSTRKPQAYFHGGPVNKNIYNLLHVKNKHKP